MLLEFQGNQPLNTDSTKNGLSQAVCSDSTEIIYATNLNVAAKVMKIERVKFDRFPDSSLKSNPDE